MSSGRNSLETLRNTPLYSGGALIEIMRSPHRDQERKLMLPLIHLAFRKLNMNRVGSETFRAMNCEMLVSPYHAIIVLVKSGTRLFNLENTSGKSTQIGRASCRER